MELFCNATLLKRVSYNNRVLTSAERACRQTYACREGSGHLEGRELEAVLRGGVEELMVLSFVGTGHLHEGAVVEFGDVAGVWLGRALRVWNVGQAWWIRGRGADDLKRRGKYIATVTRVRQLGRGTEDGFAVDFLERSQKVRGGRNRLESLVLQLRIHIAKIARS